VKVGDLVRKKQGKRVGVIRADGIWRGWVVIYWFDNGHTNQHQSLSLKVINEER
jgi:hypothetical protein